MIFVILYAFLVQKETWPCCIKLDRMIMSHEVVKLIFLWMFDSQIKMKIIVPKIGDYRSPTEIYMFNLIAIILQFRRAALSALIIFLISRAEFYLPHQRYFEKLLLGDLMHTVKLKVLI